MQRGWNVPKLTFLEHSFERAMMALPSLLLLLALPYRAVAWQSDKPHLLFIVCDDLCAMA